MIMFIKGSKNFRYIHSEMKIILQSTCICFYINKYKLINLLISQLNERWEQEQQGDVQSWGSSD